MGRSDREGKSGVRVGEKLRCWSALVAETQQSPSLARPLRSEEMRTSCVPHSLPRLLPDTGDETVHRKKHDQGYDEDQPSFKEMKEAFGFVGIPILDEQSRPDDAKAVRDHCDRNCCDGQYH